ncbi:Piso0_005258 [Millerozyma farinosa CBS 7064]|uniref:Piso0_005258 protein n=1 Tax=Pichia sorbitophila (strain ATCC MYA-4447 / BCRC 22081 / CBS 7064 / NBRC 10061 / NRRL Y-12695) TaxID=559304 RepID=G8Y1P5_PICSO|nr:Piso0_005258 [Millerozyma farinosa CBS 7064]
MPSPEELKALGNEAFSNKQYKKASKIYRDAISLSPKNPILYSNRALCFLKQEDWQRAFQDCEKGLSFDPDFKTKVKLLFRKGVACKGLSLLKQSSACFEEVLRLDPKNIAAENELKNLDQSTPDNITKTPSNSISASEKLTKIDVKEVDGLPESFLKLTNTKSDGAQKGRNITQIDSGNNDSQTHSINKDSNEQSAANDSTFNQRPSMFYLSTLSKVPADKKTSAYKFIFSLDNDYYADIFKLTGIEAEFLSFFIEASAYISSENGIPQWGQKVLEYLKTFNAQRRYFLALEFCNKEDIQKLLKNVENLGDSELLQQYRKLLIH